MRSITPLLGCGLMMAAVLGVLAITGRRRSPSPDPGDASPEAQALRQEMAQLRLLHESRQVVHRGSAPTATITGGEPDGDHR